MMKSSDIVAVGLYLISALGVGAFQYNEQQKDFRVEDRGKLHKLISDEELKGDYIRHKNPVKAMLPVYIHPLDEKKGDLIA